MRARTGDKFGLIPISPPCERGQTESPLARSPPLARSRRRREVLGSSWFRRRPQGARWYPRSRRVGWWCLVVGGSRPLTTRRGIRGWRCRDSSFYPGKCYVETGWDRYLTCAYQKASLGRRIVEEGTGASSRDRRRVKESILGGCTAVSNWLA